MLVKESESEHLIFPLSFRGRNVSGSNFMMLVEISFERKHELEVHARVELILDKSFDAEASSVCIERVQPSSLTLLNCSLSC